MSEDFCDAKSSLSCLSETQACLLDGNDEQLDGVPLNAEWQQSLKVRSKYGLSDGIKSNPAKVLTHSKSYEELFKHVDDHVTNFNDDEARDHRSRSHGKEVATLISILQTLIRRIIDELVIMGLTMESEHVALDPLCRVIELCLHHGSKTTGWSGSRRGSLWALIEKIPFYSRSSASVSAVENVKQFSSLKNSSSKVRAWILLALMNKCLGADLGLLIDKEEASFGDIWEDWALMKSDQNGTFVCLLSSLESIDFNLYVKEQSISKEDFSVNWHAFLSRDDVNFAALKPPLVLPPHLLRENVEEIKQRFPPMPDNIQSMIEGLEEENRRFKRSIINQISQRSFLEEECDKLRRRVEKLQDQLEAQQEASKDLQSQKDALTSTVHALEATNQSLQVQLAQAQVFSMAQESTLSVNGLVTRQQHSLPTSKSASATGVSVSSTAMDEVSDLKRQVKNLQDELTLANALKDEYRRRLVDD